MAADPAAHTRIRARSTRADWPPRARPSARTEELRPLTWSHVDLKGDPAKEIPPHIMVWRSVRAGGDTKTRKSRRTLALPARCVTVLRCHRQLLDRQRDIAREGW